MKIRRSKILLSAASAFLVLILPGIAQGLPSSVKAPLMDFERDTATTYPNGFSSVDNSITSFADSSGADLSINDASPQTIGQGLRIAPDYGSRLIMTFSTSPSRSSRRSSGTMTQASRSPAMSRGSRPIEAVSSSTQLRS